jgi:hypothetical protein
MPAIALVAAIVGADANAHHEAIFGPGVDPQRAIPSAAMNRFSCDVITRRKAFSAALRASRATGFRQCAIAPMRLDCRTTRRVRERRRAS